MTRNLNEYFENAKKLKDQIPPFTNEELEAILSKPIPKTKRHYVKKFKGLIIMLLLLISVVSMFVISTNIESDKTNKSSSDNEQTELTTSTSNSEEYVKKQQSGKEKEQGSISYYNKNEIKTNKQENNDNMITAVDDSLILRRPYRFSKPIENSTRTMTAQKSKQEKPDPEDLILNNRKGESITGITELNLTYDELKNLGIIVSDDKIEFITEKWHRIHPVSFKNDNNYRYEKDVYPYFKCGYPTTGDTFLIKEKNSIDLNYKLDPNRDTLVKWPGRMMIKPSWVVDTIDGKEVKLQKEIISEAENPLFNGMRYERFNELRDNMNWGYKLDILNYVDWKKESYSKVAPISFAFNYNPIQHKYRLVISKSPLLADKENKYNLDYSELLPVTINFSENKLINKIIFWFVPNEEFISKLPIRYQEEIRKEVDVLNSINNGNMPSEEACSKIKDSSFFDVCRINSGAITIENISPNPIYDRTTLTFSLKEKREISISLHDINGNFIGSFVDSKIYRTGEHDIPITFKNQSDGIYLIAIKSSKGEIAAGRIIINK
jgi:hypothetical protein